MTRCGPREASTTRARYCGSVTSSSSPANERAARPTMARLADNSASTISSRDTVATAAPLRLGMLQSLHPDAGGGPPRIRRRSRVIRPTRRFARRQPERNWLFGAENGRHRPLRPGTSVRPCASQLELFSYSVEVDDMSLAGPVQLLAIAFDGSAIPDRVRRAVADLRDNADVRLVEVLGLIRDPSGAIEWQELPDLWPDPTATGDMLRALLDRPVSAGVPAVDASSESRPGARAVLLGGDRVPDPQDIPPQASVPCWCCWNTIGPQRYWTASKAPGCSRSVTHGSMAGPCRRWGSGPRLPNGEPGPAGS